MPVRRKKLEGSADCVAGHYAIFQWNLMKHLQAIYEKTNSLSLLHRQCAVKRTVRQRCSR